MWVKHGIEPEELDYSTMEVKSAGYPLRARDRRIDVLSLSLRHHGYAQVSRASCFEARSNPLSANGVKRCGRTSSNTAHRRRLRRAQERCDQRKIGFNAELSFRGNLQVLLPSVRAAARHFEF